MIKNYNLYLLNEGVTVSNEDIVDILKSLESKDNKNAALIKRLVNTTDNKGKSVLMNIAQSNNEELIDYVLKYNVDINHKTKSGENVLFFCKKLSIFNKFYNLGADVTIINKNKRNVLTYLASRKMYNEELYQKLINDGVDINYEDDTRNNVLTQSITNKKIVLLLIKNRIDLNTEIVQRTYLEHLFYDFKYYPKKRKSTIEIFKILFENGMNIINQKDFIENVDNIDHIDIVDIVEYFIKPLKKYFTEDMIIEICQVRSALGVSPYTAEFAIKLLNLDIYPNFYKYLKVFFREHFQYYFEDFIKKNPFYDDMEKYNL